MWAGTWRSDRRRTLQFYKPAFAVEARSIELEVAPASCPADDQLSDWSQPYEVVAIDETSVIVRNDGILSQIHFEKDYYWIAVGGFLCEYFRRIA